MPLLRSVSVTAAPRSFFGIVGVTAGPGASRVPALGIRWQPPGATALRPGQHTIGLVKAPALANLEAYRHLPGEPASTPFSPRDAPRNRAENGTPRRASRTQEPVVCSARVFLRRRHTLCANGDEVKAMAEYRIISADSHLQIIPERWTPRVPAKYQDHVPRKVRMPDGGDAILIGDKPQYGQGNLTGRPYANRWPLDRRLDDKPGGGSPEQRVREQDIDGVDGEILFTHAASADYYRGIKDIGAYNAVIHAWNEFLVEEYCAVAPKRLIGLGLIPGSGIEEAIEELEYCARVGLKGVILARYPSDADFPKHAIEQCLNKGGIGEGELDYVVFYEKPLVKFERLLKTWLAYAPRGFRSFHKALPLWATHRLRMPQQIMSGLGPRFRGQVCFTDHHESHAASAFFPSPFDEAAILTFDAVGEWSTSSIGFGQGGQIKLTHEMRFPHSLGMLYSAFTYYTGFKVNSGEYKLMGLAPYGQPRYVDTIKERIANVNADGSLWLDMSYFNYCQGLTMTSAKFHDLFGGPPRSPESFLTQKEMDLAASVQVVCEEVVLRAAQHAHQITGMRNLVMAGGVALNCVANGKVLRDGPFDDVWVQPAAGDAGGAVGAALLIWHHLLGNPRHPNGRDGQKGSLLGPEFGNDEIGLFLDSVGAIYEPLNDETALLERVANLLAQEKVVGWLHGPMEFGPRALGCRSILGDARSPRMQQTMNQKIKFRESFRPFAPCVLKEYAHEVFEMRANKDSAYMLFVAPVREEWRVPLSPADVQKMQDPDLRVRVAVPRSKVPAITHVDYSARVQTVDADTHGRFYRLMSRFHEITGSPVLVNTSFNIRGEPIVCTPEDALRCFMATDIDCLVLENHVLMKRAQPEGLLQGAEAYRARYGGD